MMIGVTDLQITENWIEVISEIDMSMFQKIQPIGVFRKEKWRAGTHHLHIYIYNSDEWRNNILFRDFLISHEWARKEYRELKERLAITYAFDRVSYTKAKAPFIRKILELARIQ